jgi:hypothetical protein
LPDPITYWGQLGRMIDFVQRKAEFQYQRSYGDFEVPHIILWATNSKLTIYSFEKWWRFVVC